MGRGPAKELTDRQEKFCKRFIECCNASEAYRHAYNTENMKPSTVWKKASDLKKRSLVRTRIQELRDEHKETVFWSREKSIEVLGNIALSEKDQNGKDINIKDRVAAIRELNSMHGWKSETVDNVSSDGSMSPEGLSDDDLEQRLRNLLDPDKDRH